MLRCCAWFRVALALFIGSLLVWPAASLGQSSALVVAPDRVLLRGNFSRAQLVVSKAAGPADARSSDVTGQATYASSNETVAAVSNAGQVTARGNGEAVI